jgi:hypothetical protein
VVEVSKTVRRLGSYSLKDALDRVGEDGHTPAEKETSAWFAKPDDHARIFTAEAGIARRLLAHPGSRPQTLNVLDAAGDRASIPPADYDGETIVGVVVTVPVGTLSVKSEPRTTDQHAAIVSPRVLDSVDGWGRADR